MYYTNLNSPNQTYDVNHPILHFVKTNVLKLVTIFIIILLFMEYASYIYVYANNNNQNLTPNFSTRKDDFFFEDKFRLLESTSSNRKIDFSEDMLLKDLNLSNENGSNVNSSQPSLPSCPVIPPNLIGRIKLMTDQVSFEQLELEHPELEPGGHFKPSNCKAVQKVAVIIPYRAREEHLRKFLHNIHPFLQKQQAEYVIYVVEQVSRFCAFKKFGLYFLPFRIRNLGNCRV